MKKYYADIVNGQLKDIEALVSKIKELTEEYHTHEQNGDAPTKWLFLVRDLISEQFSKLSDHIRVHKVALREYNSSLEPNVSTYPGKVEDYRNIGTIPYLLSGDHLDTSDEGKVYTISLYPKDNMESFDTNVGRWKHLTKETDGPEDLDAKKETTDGIIKNPYGYHSKEKKGIHNDEKIDKLIDLLTTATDLFIKNNSGIVSQPAPINPGLFKNHNFGFYGGGIPRGCYTGDGNDSVMPCGEITTTEDYHDEPEDYTHPDLEKTLTKNLLNEMYGPMGKAPLNEDLKAHIDRLLARKPKQS